ncbi:MAG: molecular chaperone DnaJ [Candidatus Neomarinimicrobiota bacterium]
MRKDFYEILGVDRNAAESEIKRKYRKLAMRYHPDRNPGDGEAEQKFKEAAEAYSVLSDPGKRTQYDQFGHAGMEGGTGGFGGFGFADFDLSDALRTFMEGFGSFDDFFGGATRRPQRRRAGDLRITLELTLEEVALGVEKTVKLRRLEICDTCGGGGAQPGTKPSQCPNCNGTGQVRQISRSLFGQFVNVGQCPHCGGKGEIVTDPCRTCSGEGRVRRSVQVKVEVPAGVSTGNYMTQRGEGNKGPRGAENGDLIIFFEEKEHRYFTRHGVDILTQAEITISQAALGDSVEIPTLTGKARLTIPAGIQSGQVLRMKGKGIPELRGSRRGNQLVSIQVKTPTSLNSKEKALLKELASSNGSMGKTVVRRIPT